MPSLRYRVFTIVLIPYSILRGILFTRCMMPSLPYRVFTIVLIAYSILGGILFEVPRLPILNESIRVLYVHVPMWFGMVFLYTVSAFYALSYLRNNNRQSDALSYACAEVGTFFGILGIITGMIWAKYTWGAAWSNDPKQNAAVVTILIYLAYLVLRNSVLDHQLSARMGGIYNVLGYAIMWPLVFVLPRFTDSLHPGSGGNPGFNTYDLDYNMRLVFYPAVLGWMLWGLWLARLRAQLICISRRNT